MMKRKLLLTITLLCIIAPIAYAANWQNVKTYTSISDQTTEYFKVDAQEWRIHWSYTPGVGIAGDLAGFSVFVYPKGDTAFYVDVILKMGKNETSGTTYIHQGQKEYYLKIGVVNLAAAGYTITVEQDAETIPNPANATLIGAVILIIIIVAIVLAVLLLKRRRKPKQPLPPPPS